MASIVAVPASIGANTDRTVTLSITASDPCKDQLSYSYICSGGQMIGQGAAKVWDLGGVQPGTYAANLLVDDGKGCSVYISTSVDVER